MPNRKTHTGVGIGVLILFSYLPIIKLFDLNIIHVIVFLVATNLPDVIEPAKNYKHRQFFHSWFVLFILIAISVQ